MNHPYYNNEGNQPYPGQYYCNDYSNGASANNMLPTENINSFFEQKQHHQYYDQSYYPHENPNAQHLVSGPPPSHPSFNNGDNCDNYGFQQHYEQNQVHNSSMGPHHHHHHPNFSSSQIHGPIGNSHLQGISSQNSQHYFGNFEIPHGTSISATHFENSNSSSDFNFLSNIANDFQAPEYYQLS